MNPLEREARRERICRRSQTRTLPGCQESDEAIHGRVVVGEGRLLLRCSSRHRKVRSRVPGISPETRGAEWFLAKVFAQMEMESP
jgi:hypothetical protein